MLSLVLSIVTAQMRTQLAHPGPYRRPHETEVIVPISFNCQRDTAWSYLRKKPQLRDCQDQTGLCALSVWVVLIDIDGELFSPAWMVRPHG